MTAVRLLPVAADVRRLVDTSIELRSGLETSTSTLLPSTKLRKVPFSTFCVFTPTRPALAITSARLATGAPPTSSIVALAVLPATVLYARPSASAICVVAVLPFAAAAIVFEATDRLLSANDVVMTSSGPTMLARTVLL